MATNTGFAVAQAMILAAPPKEGYGQSTADIYRSDNYGFGQAQGAVVKFAKQNAFGQSQAQIV